MDHKYSPVLWPWALLSQEYPGLKITRRELVTSLIVLFSILGNVPRGAQGGGAGLEAQMGRMAVAGRGRGRGGRPALSAEEKRALTFKSYDLVPTR